MTGTKRCIHFLAKKEIFSTWFTKHFFNSAGLIPVNRQSKDHDALVSAKEHYQLDIDSKNISGLRPIWENFQGKACYKKRVIQKNA
jgi:1-acyl-sn-glycerol-3-phosphate acyltransferase